MQPNDFLEYLCGLGLAQRDKTYVRVSHPHYPYHNSGYVTKGTEFKDEIIYYHIQLEISIQNDKIVVHDPDGGKVPATILDSLFTFLKKWAYLQPSGNMLTSKFATGVNKSPYRAVHLGPSINIDELMIILSAITPIGPGSILSFAMALNYLKDIIVERKGKRVEKKEESSEEQETKKERNRFFKYKDDYIPGTEYSPANMERRGNLIPLDSIVVSFDIQNFTDVHMIPSQPDTLYYHRGDTIYKYEKRLYYSIPDSPDKDTIKTTWPLTGGRDFQKQHIIIKPHNRKKPESFNR